LHPSVLRGLVLISQAMESNWSWVNTLRSVLLGRYCRSRPLVFSALPRAMRMSEVNGHAGLLGKGFVVRHLGALIVGHRAAQLAVDAVAARTHRPAVASNLTRDRRTAATQSGGDRSRTPAQAQLRLDQTTILHLQR
jgi:hypothetical protein